MQAIPRIQLACPGNIMQREEEDMIGSNPRRGMPLPSSYQQCIGQWMGGSGMSMMQM